LPNENIFYQKKIEVCDEMKPTVIADHRESQSGVIQHLLAVGVDVKFEKLDVGDYIIGDVGIERKTAGDFLQSIVDGRLLNQAKLLSETFEHPIIIIEGTDLHGRRLIHPNAIRGALAALSTDLGVSVIQTTDEEDTAGFIAVIARRSMKKKREIPLERRKPPSPTLDRLQRFVLEGLPGVSVILAERLLRKFKTVERVMMASEAELMLVPGIGPKKAKKIREILTSPYEFSQQGI